MGARGPAPTPTPILEMRGSWRARTRAGEPRPQKAAPRCPSHLGPAQKAVWRAVCKLLADMGVLTVADGAQLERYAVYFVRWRAIQAFVAAKDLEHAKSGTVVPPGSYPVFSTDAETYVAAAANGVALIGFYPYPCVAEGYRLDKALKEIEGQFGLTPAARVRLSVAGAARPEADEFEDLLRGPRSA